MNAVLELINNCRKLIRDVYIRHKCNNLDPSVIKVPSVITFGPKRNKGPICNNIWTQV